MVGVEVEWSQVCWVVGEHPAGSSHACWSRGKHLGNQEESWCRHSRRLRLHWVIAVMGKRDSRVLGNICRSWPGSQAALSSSSKCCVHWYTDRE